LTIDDRRVAGDYAMQAKQYGLAITAFTDWIDLCERSGQPITADHHERLGKAYYWDNQDATAVEHFRLAVQLTRDRTKLPGRLAAMSDAQAYAGQYAAALETLGRAKDLGLSEAGYYFRAGRINTFREYTEQARRCFQRCIKADPDGPLAEQARQWLSDLN
jgi:tetratricopeptide (TPR) repeat protein